MPLITPQPTRAAYDPIAHNYDQGRPDYPVETVRTLLSHVAYTSGLVMCDLGAGTGKLSRILRSIDPQMQLIGVEAAAKMCAIFAQTVPEAQIFQASAEQIPLPDASVDIVLVGTAFHWFATKRALAEIARILKPGGRLGLIWNIFDAEIAWVKAVRTAVNAYRTAEELSCNHDALEWQKVFATTTLFAPLQHETYRYTFSGSRQDVINRVVSSKVIGDLDEHAKTTLFADVDGVLKKYNSTADALHIPYRIEMYWNQKR